MIWNKNCNSWRFVLYGVIVCGFLICSALSGPTSNNQPTSATNVNDDYQYNDDEESGGGPGEQIKSTSTKVKATALPYFEKNVTIVLVKPTDTEISLKCPAKNLGEGNVILWYQGNNLITNGLQVLNNAFKVNNTDFDLIIKNLTSSHYGNYYCEVLPQKIRLHTILRVATEADEMGSEVPPPPPELAQSKKAAAATEPASSPADRLQSLSRVFTFLSTILLIRMLACHRVF